MPCVVSNLLGPLGPVVAAPGENRDRCVLDVDLHAIAANLISCIQRAPDGSLVIDVAKAGSMKPG
jgi:hypothetical protein